MEGLVSYIEYDDVAKERLNGEKGKAPKDWSYETDRLKSVITFKNVEFRLRLCLLMLAWGILAVAMSDLGIVALGLIQLLTTLAFVSFTARLPKRVGLGMFRWICIAASLVALTHLMIGIYFWVHPVQVFQFLSLLTMGVSMVAAISSRSNVRFLKWIDGTFITAAVVIRVAWLPFSNMAALDAAVLGVSLVLVTVYFWVAFTNALRDAQAAADRRRIEGEDAKFLAVGRLTGGIAHDFNNMLTAVLGNLELSRLTHDRAEQLLLIEEAEASAKRGAQLTRELLALSGRSHVTLAAFDLRDIVEGAIGMLSDEKRGETEIRVRIDPDVPMVRADRVLLCHAIAKLLDNGVDAAGNDGRVSIEAKRSNIAAESTVTISIQDTGKGISEDMRPFVFEPYFTTKPVGEGSGLGLPMAKGVVEQLGGQIILSSMPGRGTEVLVHLPAA